MDVITNQPRVDTYFWIMLIDTLVATKNTLVGWVIFRDDILPSYIGVIMNHYKDPY